MASVYLSGILTAWCLTQLALGVFFALAHFVARRERDFGLFGAMCLSLAYHSACGARAHVAQSVAERQDAASAVIAASLLAAAFNLHFVSAFTALPRKKSVMMAGVYAAVIVFELANATGNWWRPGTGRVVSAFILGFRIDHFRAETTLLARAGFLSLGVALVSAQALLFAAYRTGKREALIAFAGGLVVVGAAANDVLLVTGTIDHTLYLVPHAFMLYAFSVATTLVVRYRRTVGELMRAENDLQRATEQLRASHAELEDVQSQLVTQQELAAVGELAAAIAHEVRNPLAVITNALAGLKRTRIEDEDRVVLLGIVEEETERLNRLVTDLLRFARPTSLRKTGIDLPELLQLGEAALSERHQLNVHVVDGAPRQLDADPNLLRAVFDNLIQNACQSMPQGGAVDIYVSAEDHAAVAGAKIEVRDTGSGMDGVTLARALDPFFTTRPSGTGLGLPIVQRIVHAHGGDFVLDSAPGRGTSARIWLPLHGPDPASSRPSSEQGAPLTLGRA